MSIIATQAQDFAEARAKAREITKFFADNSCYKTHYRTTAFDMRKYLEFAKILRLPPALISQAPIEPFTIDADLYNKAVAYFVLLDSKFAMGGKRPENIPEALVKLIVEFIPRETAEYIEINHETVRCKLCSNTHEPCNIKLGWWGWQAHIKSNKHKLHVSCAKTRPSRYNYFPTSFEAVNYLSVFNYQTLQEQRHN